MKTCNTRHQASNVQDLKKSFGEEYPTAIVQDGVRMPLVRESRFSRWYHSEEQKISSVLSRFMDGSASITALDLQREWPHWTKTLQTDFCQSCYWLSFQNDFPEILRYIMQHGCPTHWSAIALHVASALPQQEAFDALAGALQKTEIGHTSNITQAIAQIKQPPTESVLRDHLAKVWAHPNLWNNADFMNWIAFDATTSIAHLLKLDAAPADFAGQARQLSQHVCPKNRDACSRYLSKHYPEIHFSI